MQLIGGGYAELTTVAARQCRKLPDVLPLAEGALAEAVAVGHNLRLLAALGLDKPHPVGHSMGGWVAAEIAAVAGGRFGKLVLNAPFCSGSGAMSKLPSRRAAVSQPGRSA